MEQAHREELPLFDWLSTQVSVMLPLGEWLVVLGVVMVLLCGNIGLLVRARRLRRALAEREAGSREHPR